MAEDNRLTVPSRGKVQRRHDPSATGTMNLGTSYDFANGQNALRQISTLRYHIPGTFPSSDHDSASQSSYPPTPPTAGREQSPALLPVPPLDASTGKKRSKRPAARARSRHKSPPTPTQTPPVPHSPPQRTPSRMSSSIAESFRTAREDPWQSVENVSSLRSIPNSPYLNGKASGPSSARGAGLGFETDMDHTPTQSRVNLSTQSNHSPQPSPTAKTMEYVPDREWDTSLMRNITVRRKKPLVNGMMERQPDSPSDKISAASSSTATVSQGPITPPTTYLTNGMWQTPPRHNTSQPTSIDSAHRASPQRNSALSSSSTVIEAHIFTPPKQEPRGLRRVSKAYSLRDDGDSTETGRLSARIVSESAVVPRTHQRQPPEPSLGVHYERDQGQRAVTDPSLIRTKERTSPKKEMAQVKAPQARSPKSNHKRAASELSPITSPTSSFRTSASTLGRTLSQNSARNRDSLLVRNATQRALERALSPTFTPMPSSTSESLTSVIKNQLVITDSFHALASHPPITSGSGVDEDVVAIDEDYLAPLPSGNTIGRRLSDAGSARSKVSVDRFTMKSEDHPRHLYAQTTPFSQISAFSARDVLEVGEGKAIDIYPHNNESLLLVDGGLTKPSPPLAQDQDLYVPSIVSKPRVQIQPSTPPTQPAEFSSNADSPLKNPRKPPLPPTINILPATPAQDEDVNPLESRAPKDNTPVRPSSLLERARKYSDSLLTPFLGRNGSLKRSHSYGKRPDRPQRTESAERHLHPTWQPRSAWENGGNSESDSDFEDDDDFGDLPPGGDTSEPPPPSSLSGFLPRRMTKRLPGFRGSGGFLMGNSLGLERHGTNVRRHHVVLPRDVRDRRSGNLLQESHHLQHKHSLSDLNLVAKSKSLSSIRSAEAAKRRRRTKRKLQVEWIGIGGLKDKWKARKAEKRRDEIRRSIGPKFLIEQGIGVGGAGGSDDVRAVRRP